MAKLDANGMLRVDMEWEIQGRNGTNAGKLFGLHEQEVMGAKAAVKRRARRGDTVIMKTI